MLLLLMSKQMKLKCCLFLIDFNQLTTAVVFFHWHFFHDCAVDAVKDLWVNIAYLGLHGVDESAGPFVCEVPLMVLNECVFVSCSVHSVVDSQFHHDVFVFLMNCLRCLGWCFLVRFCDVFFQKIIVCRWL